MLELRGYPFDGSRVMYRTYAALPATLQSRQELLPAVPMLSESVIDGVEDVEVEWAILQTDSGDKGKAAAMATIRATLSRFNLPVLINAGIE